MFLIVAVVSIVLWTLGIVVLHVPSGPIHLLLGLAAAALVAHVAGWRPFRRRSGGSIQNLAELEEGTHRANLRLQSDGHGRSFIS
ncbi:MAG: DUF5670 family protein [Gemmatimonadota bacterium]